MGPKRKSNPNPIENVFRLQIRCIQICEKATEYSKYVTSLFKSIINLFTYLLTYTQTINHLLYKLRRLQANNTISPVTVVIAVALSSSATET